MIMWDGLGICIHWSLGLQCSEDILCKTDNFNGTVLQIVSNTSITKVDRDLFTKLPKTRFISLLIVSNF